MRMIYKNLPPISKVFFLPQKEAATSNITSEKFRRHLRTGRRDMTIRNMTIRNMRQEKYYKKIKQ